MHSSSIYIVEDELLIAASLKSQLQQSGYFISGSSIRGETCLEDIARLSEEGREPEIVLMDIHLRGELDGIETARLITDKFNCAIIFLTGQSSKEVYERSFSIKPFGYLLKPIDMDQTKMTIEIAAYQRNLEIQNKIYQHDLEVLLKKRNDEISELMNMYQTIIDNSLMGLTIMQNEHFVFANHRTAEIFGYDLEEFLKLSIVQILQLLHPDDREKVVAISRMRLQGQEVPRHTQIRIITRNGKEKMVDTYVSAVSFKGKPALHQTFLDISPYIG
jgi:PAS domain S-box-containing protein